MQVYVFKKITLGLQVSAQVCHYVIEVNPMPAMRRTLASGGKQNHAHDVATATDGLSALQ
jgi:hypothetical protein